MWAILLAVLNEKADFDVLKLLVSTSEFGVFVLSSGGGEVGLGGSKRGGCRGLRVFAAIKVSEI